MAAGELGLWSVAQANLSVEHARAKAAARTRTRARRPA
jgi:hypothetical protein